MVYAVRHHVIHFVPVAGEKTLFTGFDIKKNVVVSGPLSSVSGLLNFVSGLVTVVTGLLIEIIDWINSEMQ